MVEGREKRRKQSGVTYRRPWGSKGVQMQTPNLTIYGDTPRLPCHQRETESCEEVYKRKAIQGERLRERTRCVFKCAPHLQRRGFVPPESDMGAGYVSTQRT